MDGMGVDGSARGESAHACALPPARPPTHPLTPSHTHPPPQLRKLDKPVDVEGNPWPLDANGQPILKA